MISGLMPQGPPALPVVPMYGSQCGLFVTAIFVFLLIVAATVPALAASRIVIISFQPQLTRIPGHLESNIWWSGMGCRIS